MVTTATPRGLQPPPRELRQVVADIDALSAQPPEHIARAWVTHHLSTRPSSCISAAAPAATYASLRARLLRWYTPNPYHLPTTFLPISWRRAGGWVVHA